MKLNEKNIIPGLISDKDYSKLNKEGLLYRYNVINYNMMIQYNKLIKNLPEIEVLRRLSEQTNLKPITIKRKIHEYKKQIKNG